MALLDLINRPERKRCRDLRQGISPPLHRDLAAQDNLGSAGPGVPGCRGLSYEHTESIPHSTSGTKVVTAKHNPSDVPRHATKERHGRRPEDAGALSVWVKGCPGHMSPRLLVQDPPSAHAAILSGSARAETADRQQAPAVPRAVCSHSVQEAGSVTARVVRGGVSTAPMPD